MEVARGGTDEYWSNNYFQQVYIPDSTVQRGKDAFESAAYTEDVTITAVDTEVCSIFAQIHYPYTAGRWDALSNSARMEDSTSLIFERNRDMSPTTVWWQVIEWPSGWFNIQTVVDTGMTKTVYTMKDMIFQVHLFHLKCLNLY